MVGALELPFLIRTKALRKSGGKIIPIESKQESPALPAPKPSRSIPIGDVDEITAGRFWNMVARGDDGACWPWIGGTSAAGYGRFKWGGKLYSSHRMAYAIAYGGVLAGKGYHGTVIMHACDNPACCNPAHLAAGTHRDNAKDMGAKGRNHIPRGQRRAPISRLSLEGGR